jgi:hypothetical protein
MIMPLTLLEEDQVSSILRPNLWSDLQRHPPSLILRAVGRVRSIPPLSRRHCSTASDVENTLTVSSQIEQPKYGVNWLQNSASEPRDCCLREQPEGRGDSSPINFRPLTATMCYLWTC